ncbi:hypothetical protein U9M48_018567 [Paspalum notatum var. saurae]|uniref:Reverse transcriptase domain-containing protein n=1 Tax=Paspalum notatum var. saurae TaxID=547442 RepID=A0AAQ3TDU7_PASNO
MSLELREGRDVFKWGLNKTGLFSVKSMYKSLINNGIKVSQVIWQTNIPLKTKIFIWYVKRGVLLTKDNLARRNWYGQFPSDLGAPLLTVLMLFKNSISGRIPHYFCHLEYLVLEDLSENQLHGAFPNCKEQEKALNRLNFGNIILIPKVGDASKIQQYRPICLLNVSFKIFTKVATNRILKVAHKIIWPSQTAFLPGRNIMEGVVVLHETLHELHRKNLNGVIFKIDFEKAYDKVRWDFLQQTLHMKGFSTTWCNWIKSFVQGGNVAINVNGQNDAYFQTRKA